MLLFSEVIAGLCSSLNDRILQNFYSNRRSNVDIKLISSAFHSDVCYEPTHSEMYTWWIVEAIRWTVLLKRIDFRHSAIASESWYSTIHNRKYTQRRTSIVLCIGTVGHVKSFRILFWCFEWTSFMADAKSIQRPI